MAKKSSAAMEEARITPMRQGCQLGRGLLVGSIVLFGVCAPSALGQETFPSKEWAKAEPGAVGLNSKALAGFDADISAGKYGFVDSMLVIRCGKQAYAKTYPHDYGKTYGELAKKAGPLN